MIRSAGIVFTTREWTPVPAWAEAEIIANIYLVTDRPVIDDDAPPKAAEREIGANAPEDEPIKVTDEEPQTVEDKAVKLVVTKHRKGTRKL